MIQMEAVRLFSKHDLFKAQNEELALFEDVSTCNPMDNKQACHSMETAKLLEFDLKKSLEQLVADIFQEKLDFRWVGIVHWAFIIDHILVLLYI